MFAQTVRYGLTLDRPGSPRRRRRGRLPPLERSCPAVPAGELARVRDLTPARRSRWRSSRRPPFGCRGYCYRYVLATRLRTCHPSDSDRHCELLPDGREAMDSGMQRVIDRFPEARGGRSGTCFHADQSFREICGDYADTLEALQRWQASDGPHKASLASRSIGSSPERWRSRSLPRWDFLPSAIDMT